jgi:hypothetical protein
VPTDQDSGSLAQPPAIPDHVPDELVAKYGRRAEHQVRYRRSGRYRVTFRARRVVRPLADTSVWMMSVMIFFWMVVTAAIVGGLTYAIVLRPWVGLYIVGPLVLMFLVSLLVAMRMSHRGGEQTEPIIRLP